MGDLRKLMEDDKKRLAREELANIDVQGEKSKLMNKLHNN